MTLQGWQEKYKEILREFDYDKKKDMRSAQILNMILKDDFPLKNLERKIKNKTVFVIGAGPSLTKIVPVLKRFRNITKIVADGATGALIENKIKPDIVVTDLDGNWQFLKKTASNNSVMVVHSHGDNIEKLPVSLAFRYCIGTTEGKPFRKIRNFGGFTDGDRCVFLARHFGARKIFLFGMDFGTKVGRYSKELNYDKRTKLRKLRKAKSLLEWLALKGGPEFYTTSAPIKGFRKIRFSELRRLVRP
jgi:2-amino-4-hydroxy-6-hydroxymethyldihydropteridine diphosphokinase